MKSMIGCLLAIEAPDILQESQEFSDICYPELERGHCLVDRDIAALDVIIDLKHSDSVSLDDHEPQTSNTSQRQRQCPTKCIEIRCAMIRLAETEHVRSMA